MNDEMKRRVREWIEDGKEMLKSDPEFFQSEEARGVFVVMLTLEGAVLFDDVVELGQTCSKFCEERQAESIIRNN